MCSSVHLFTLSEPLSRSAFGYSVKASPYSRIALYICLYISIAAYIYVSLLPAVHPFTLSEPRSWAAFGYSVKASLIIYIYIYTCI